MRVRRERGHPARKNAPSRSTGSACAGSVAENSTVSMRSTTAATTASMVAKWRNTAPSVIPTSCASARAVKWRAPCAAMTRMAASAISVLADLGGLAGLRVGRRHVRQYKQVCVYLQVGAWYLSGRVARRSARPWTRARPGPPPPHVTGGPRRGVPE